MNAKLLSLICCALLLSACSSSQKQRAGGYYQDDGPGTRVPADIARIPDAVPREETPARANLRPYTVFGKHYVPISGDQALRQTGVASWYGRKFHGKQTANGEIYDMYAMTAAHPTLPLPSYARVTNARNGRAVVVRINDRGPFHSARIIDLSYVAAAKLGLIGPGSGQVIVEAITNADIRQAAARQADDAPPGEDPLASLIAQSATAAQGPEEQYFLQFGAFTTQTNALDLAASLNRRIQGMGVPPARVSSAETLHRVRIGPYDNRSQAMDAATRIETETGRKASFILLDAERAPVRQAASL